MINLTEKERKSLAKYISHMEENSENDGHRVKLYLQGKTQEACAKIFGVKA